MNLQRIYNRSLARLIASALLFASVVFPLRAQQEQPPKPQPPRAVEFPKPFERTLKNGLRVIVVERHEVPLVTAQVVVKSGAESDPENLAGLAEMTANLLTKGTTTRSATEIAEQIEALGGSIETAARWDASVAQVDVMSSRLPQALEILADVVRNPSFKDEEIERQRAQTLDEVRVALGQPGSLARYVAARVVFGGMPYGHTINGTPETLQRIKRDDIVKLHSEIFRPDNAILVIGGDIAPDNGFSLAEKFFGSWQSQRAQQAKPKPANPNNPFENVELVVIPTHPPDIYNGSKIVVIDKPDAGQAAVVVTRKGIARTDPDYFRALVTNAVLGGGYSARLNEEVRIKRGLSYGAGSQIDARRGVGLFTAAAQTKNESAAEVAQIMLDEVSKLATAPVPTDEMTPRKATLTGDFGRQLETNAGFVARVASLALYGLSLNEINRFIPNVEAVNASDVQKFAAAKLDAKTSNVVIVGDGRKILDDLRKRFKDIDVIPVAELDLNSATLRRRASNAASDKAASKNE